MTICSHFQKKDRFSTNPTSIIVNQWVKVPGTQNFYSQRMILQKKIFKIVESKKPKHKYNLAMDAAFMDNIMTKFIPLSWRFGMNKRMYKLNIQNTAKTISQKAFIQSES